MRHRLDPIALYRFALRCGDLPLVDALTRAFRADTALSRGAERELLALPRGALPARHEHGVIEQMRMSLRPL